MTTFDKRKNTFESKFANDELAKFKNLAARDLQLGKWAGKKLGKKEQNLEEYAKKVVQYNHVKPGDDDMIHSIAADFTNAKVNISVEEIISKLQEIERNISNSSN